MRTPVQALDYKIASMKSQYERDIQQQATLKAAADAHACNLADRDDCVREVAALCGISDLAGTASLTDADLRRYAILHAKVISLPGQTGGRCTCHKELTNAGNNPILQLVIMPQIAV